MPTHKPTFRIFLSSPGDVASERKIAREVLESLNNDPFVKGKAVIEAVAWDAPGSRVLMPVSLTPQQAIDSKLAKPSETDAVFVLFWGRMGTPLDVDSHGTKPDGTPYLSGTEWEYLDAVQGSKKHPSKLPIVMVYRRTDTPPQPEGDDLELLAAWIEQRKRVKSFFEQFRDISTGAYKGNVIEYANPNDFREKFTQDARLLVNELLSLQGQSDSSATPEFTSKIAQIGWKGSPFPGLRPFTEKDEPIFFGRSMEVADLIKRLSNQRLMFVVGASGSGKSSLVGAGVIPQLKRGAVYGVADWYMVRFTPGDAPFKRLSAALIKTIPALKDAIADDDERAVQLAEVLRKSPDKLLKQVEKWLTDEPEGTEILLFADQLEELFTTTSEAECHKFAAMLSTPSSQIRVIATIRSDFYDNALPYFEQTLRDGSYTLGIPSPVALYQMITRPAEATGLQFEDGLAEKLVEDTSGQAGALALMAYTLDELYKIADTRHDRRLTLADYQGLGGVQGAIGKRAEQTFQSLSLTDKETLLGRVFRELVEVDERGTATRQRSSQGRFGEQELALIQAFTDARLLVMDEKEVEVAHEALFRSWERLKDWIAEAQEDLILLRQVRNAAHDWESKGRLDYLLWPQERLVLVYAMQERLNPELTRVESDYIEPEQARLLRELKTLPKTAASHERRRDIGDRLAVIGDARPGVGVKGGIPDVDWLPVNSSDGWQKFSLGSRYTIQCEVMMFYISKYQVTNCQFEAFLDAPDGYRDERWWSNFASEEFEKEELQSIYNRRSKVTNLPCDAITWYQAMAFAQWVNYKLQDIEFSYQGYLLRVGDNAEVRLPTEWEWQWAAMGGIEARQFIWGREWEDGYANTAESGLSRTIAVGMYPHSTAICGAMDMVGNICCWCINNAVPTRNVMFGGNNADQKSARGGSFRLNRDFATTTSRSFNYPNHTLDYFGLRLVIAPSIDEVSSSIRFLESPPNY